MTNLLDPIETNTSDPLADIVGEGKKYRDMQALRKAVDEKDAYIKHLQKESSENRRDADMRMSLEEFWQKTQAGSNSNDTSSNQVTTPQSERVVSPSEATPSEPIDMKAMIRDVLRQETSKAQEHANVTQAKQEIAKAWGNDYANRLQEKASEIGVNVEFLTQIAAKSPKALINILGITETSTPTNTQIVPTSRNTSAIPSASNVRNHAYYESIRQTDPKRYRTPEVQNQRFKDARAMGDKFYD